MEEDNVDPRSLVYTETVNPNLVCCICQCPFVDPVVLPCGHTFCEACMYQACEASPFCPYDRSSITLSDIKPAVKIIANMVNELSVACPRAERGCPHVGQRQYIDKHMKNECQYTLASCTLDECKEKVLKKDLITHTANCKYRAAECKMCKRKMRAFELDDHHKLCPAEIIQCPHCQSDRPRSQHTAHLIICPQHPMSCPHAEFGCPWTGERQHLDPEHLSTCPYEGIKHFLYQQRQREQTLAHELESVRKENAQLKHQQSLLDQQLESFSEQLSTLFPNHFVPGSDMDQDMSASVPHSSILAETQRLKNEIESVSASVKALELQQNMTLMTEIFRLQEELQSLRAVCHGVRMQMHYIMMDRRSLNASGTTSTAVPPGVGGSSTETTGPGNAPGPASWFSMLLDTAGKIDDTHLAWQLPLDHLQSRQETKL